jgi:hypothetical protein
MTPWSNGLEKLLASDNLENNLRKAGGGKFLETMRIMNSFSAGEDLDRKLIKVPMDSK